MRQCSHGSQRISFIRKPTQIVLSFMGANGTIQNGTASCTQIGSLTKSIPLGTSPRKVLCEWLDRSKTEPLGNDPSVQFLRNQLTKDIFNNGIQRMSIFILKNKRDLRVFALKNTYDSTNPWSFLMGIVSSSFNLSIMETFQQFPGKHKTLPKCPSFTGFDFV